MSLGLGAALRELSKAAFNNARKNAALRAAVRNQSAKRANVKARAPSPPKPKARTPSPPKPKPRTPSPPKARTLSPPKPKARTGPRRFRSPNVAAYQRLGPRVRRGAFLAPTRFIQNLVNEEARLIARSYQKYNSNLKENARLRNANLRRAREIQHIIGAIHMKTRDPTHLRTNPFRVKSPQSRRRSPVRGRILSKVHEAL